MSTATLQTHMPRPPEDLFDLLADVTNEPRWQPDVIDVKKVTDGPVGEGTVFDGRYKGFGTMRIQLTEYQRPRRIRFAATGPRAEMDVIFEFAPSGDGSEMKAEMRIDLRGAARVLTPVFGPMLRREVRKRPAQMMGAFEGEPARPRPAAAASGRRTQPD
jgi:uncharacterized protein YndB with AHSA1/START domain